MKNSMNLARTLALVLGACGGSPAESPTVNWHLSMNSAQENTLCSVHGLCISGIAEAGPYSIKCVFLQDMSGWTRDIDWRWSTDLTTTCDPKLTCPMVNSWDDGIKTRDIALACPPELNLPPPFTKVD
jgi:hypothetical protein